MAEIKGQIDKEVIDTLVSLTRNILGDKAVDEILRVLPEKLKGSPQGEI